METWILITFCIGYLLIALEHTIRINKAAIALVTGVLCWTLYIFSGDAETVTEELFEQVAEISGILFFLMGAMTIVELIDGHDGFEIINERIETRDSRKLLWILCFLTFFLSPLLDNLTTTIVMVTLCMKLVSGEKTRLMFIGLIIIAANSGGAWSPIGDVTTTMLWIGGQVTLEAIVTRLFFPSLVNLVVPLVLTTLLMGKSETDSPRISNGEKVKVPRGDQIAVFCCGLVALLLVPVFKTVTHLPPFMGMMLSLGFLWIVTQIIHWNKPPGVREQFSVARALERMDVPSVLFFLGILLAVGVLKFTGMLSAAAGTLSSTFTSEKVILACIGVLSAIVDNVPVVAAAMAMYSTDVYPVDHGFWVLLAYCAGTGGSLLIIGSAAGVAAMGIEKISFGWYLKHIAWLALTGYLAGLGAYLLQEYIFQV